MPHHAAPLAEQIAADFYGNGLKLPDTELAKGAPRKWDDMPEVKAVARVRESGASDRAVRLFLTFVAAMSRSREFTPLLCAALKRFGERPDLYEPAAVARLSEDELTDLLSGVTRKHTSDSNAWYRIACSLNDGGALASAIDTGYGDAVHLLQDLGSKDGQADRFPLLREPRSVRCWWVGWRCRAVLA